MKLASQNIDNLGLVAGMCDEIGIKDIIDKACGNQVKIKNYLWPRSCLRDSKVF